MATDPQNPSNISMEKLKKNCNDCKECAFFNKEINKCEFDHATKCGCKEPMLARLYGTYTEIGLCKNCGHFIIHFKNDEWRHFNRQYRCQSPYNHLICEAPKVFDEKQLDAELDALVEKVKPSPKIEEKKEEAKEYVKEESKTSKKIIETKTEMKTESLPEIKIDLPKKEMIEEKKIALSNEQEKISLSKPIKEERFSIEDKLNRITEAEKPKNSVKQILDTIEIKITPRNTKKSSSKE